MILLNNVIQVLAGPDERLSGQCAFGLQFGDSLMGHLIAVECDLLRGLMTAGGLFEEACGGPLYLGSYSVRNRPSGLAYRPHGRDNAIDPSL